MHNKFSSHPRFRGNGGVVSGIAAIPDRCASRVDRQSALKKGPGMTRAVSSLFVTSTDQGTNAPQALENGFSLQSMCRRFLPSYGVGRNGKFLAIPFAVISTPIVPGAPTRKLTPSPALLTM